MSYATAYTWIYDLLKTDQTELPPATLEKWVDSAIAKLRSEWPAIPEYGDLTDSDLAAMDEAAGFLVAAKMRPTRTQTTPTTDIVQIDMDGTKTQYAAPSRPDKSIVDAWIESAYEAVLRIADVATGVADLRAISLFAAAGPRRAQEARGVNTHSISSLYTILADEWDYEREHLQMITGTVFAPE